jgi:aspartate/methionine/tyrosine aminotransferase
VVAAEQVVVTVGAVNALFVALFALLDTGDELLVPDPGWPNYASICHLAGATARPYAMPAAAGFLPDPATLRAMIGPRTKALLINTPGNPSGAVFPAPLMQELAALARDTGIWLVSDEIYEDMLFGGEHVSAGACGVEDRSIVISGFSKSFAMTGWRLGWAVAPPSLAPVLAGLLEPVVSCAPTMIQEAGLAALQGDQAFVIEAAARFRHRRDILAEELAGSPLLPVVPRGAFYGFLDIGATRLGSLDFARRALAETAVAVVPGITFGCAMGCAACDAWRRASCHEAALGCRTAPPGPRRGGDREQRARLRRPVAPRDPRARAVRDRAARRARRRLRDAGLPARPRLRREGHRDPRRRECGDGAGVRHREPEAARAAVGRLPDGLAHRRGAGRGDAAARPA